jgi:hypothetical protein
MIYYQNKKVMITTKRDTLAGAMDDIIAHKGTWKQMEEEGNKHAIRFGLKTRCTPSIIRAHVKYRQIKDDNYLGHRKITDEGII